MTGAMFQATHERRIAEQCARIAAMGLNERTRGSRGRPRAIIGPDGHVYSSVTEAAEKFKVNFVTMYMRAYKRCKGWRLG